MKDFPIEIQMEENVTPIFRCPTPIPHSMREAVDKELDYLLKVGIIEQVQYSDWATNIVVVAKPDGKSVRICGNYKQTVNKGITRISESKTNRYF